MPVISGRYSTNSSSAASYLSSPSSSTYRSTYDSGRSSYSSYSTSGSTPSTYRSSNYLSSYRGGLSDSTSSSVSASRYTSSGYGVSRDKVSSLLPPTPPSSITNRRSESRQRDLISNKDYTPTTNSTLSSSTLKTANSLNRLSRLGSGERSSSLARNLATCGVDLYEKYSPSTYVSPSIVASKASSYVPKTELTRSRSLSEASKFLLNNNSLGSNGHINNINSTNHVGADGLVDLGGDKVNSNQPLQHQLQPLAGLTRNNNCNNNNNKLADCLIENCVKTNGNEFDANKNRVATEHSQKLYNSNVVASKDVCCVFSTTNNNNNSLKNNNNNNNSNNNNNNNKNSQISSIIESYNSRLNVKNTVNNIHVINSSNSVTKNITPATITTTNASQSTTNSNHNNNVTSSTKFNQISKPSTISLTSTSSSSQTRSQQPQTNNMITNLSRNKGFMSNESLNKSHRTNTATNFNFSSYRNENFLKNECELARQEVLLANQKKQKQTLNDQLKNHSNPQLTIFDINNPTSDQHGKRAASQGGGKMMNGYGTNTGKLNSRLDDDIKFIDSDEMTSGGGPEASKKRVETYKNGLDAINRRHRPNETSELNKITQKILNKHLPEQRGRDKSRTTVVSKAISSNGVSDEEIKYIDSEQSEPAGVVKASTNTSSLSLRSSTPPLPSPSLTNNISHNNNINNSHHHHHNHHSHNSKNHPINNIINNTKNQLITNNHKCDKLNNTKSKNNHLNLNSTSTESQTLGAHQQPIVAKQTTGLMEKVDSPLKTSTVTVQITPKKASSQSMAATTVTSATAVPSSTPQSSTSSNGSNGSTTCDDVNLTNLLIDNNKLTNKLNDESLRSTSSLRNALPSTTTSSSSLYRDRDSSTSSAYRSTNSYSDGYTPKRSTLLSSSIDRERKSSVTEHTEGLCGLWNIGNTCFMNSVVQCLSHTSELTKYLRSQNGTRSSSSERKDQRIFNEFVKLIKEMWSASSRSVNPSEFKMALSSKYRMYSGSTQQDAQEFLRFFLDSLHTAMNPAQKAEPVTIDDDMSDSKKADLMWDWYSKTENSVIKDLFVGQLRSTLKCSTCGTTSVTFDPFWDLSLPLPSNTRCKLENCLELFIKEEIMDGDEMPNCAKCKTRRKSTKTFTIQRFPKYLVIHLKRFSETRWSKLTNIVEFPTGERELNLAPYASDKSVPCVYSLYGISNHMGSTAGGHYVAACKHALTKKWHEFNDNSVSDISESSLVSSSAYLLFFERVPPPNFDNTYCFPHQPITVDRAKLYRCVQRRKPNSLIDWFRRPVSFRSKDVQQTTLIGFLFYTACFMFWFYVV